MSKRPDSTHRPARIHHHEHLIFSAGSQVVVLRDVHGPNDDIAHPRGSVGVIVKSPSDLKHSYRVRFPDGYEEAVKSSDLTLLAKHKEGVIGDGQISAARENLFEHVVFQCVIGSQAYGLAGDASDIDRRGIFLPPAHLHWSLYGVPEQIECHETQETYWEIQKFLVLALKANPNVLECLYTPLVEKTNPLVEELLSLRSMFLSRLVYQTYNGYVLSQFKKMQADLRNQGKVKWKHVMHLIRLLMSGIEVLREGLVAVDVGNNRDKLLEIKRGEMPWEETERWRRQLHQEFEQAFQKTKLPERPDYEKANDFLVRARREGLEKP